MMSVNFPIMRVEDFLEGVSALTPLKVMAGDTVVYDDCAIGYPEWLDDLQVFEFWINDDGVTLYIDIPVCSVCGKPMTSGFCISNGEEYYCSRDCLHEKYTDEEYDVIYDNGEGYWTEWVN